MSTHILFTSFSNIPEINTPITAEFVNRLVEYCVMFETKNEHSLALNSYLLGVYPIYFTNVENSLFFSLLELDCEKIKSILKDHPLIDPNWTVVNDPYNYMIVFTAYRVITSSLKEELKERALLSLFKMLQYKFFTSLVQHYYKFGADKEVMDATIKDLTARYDIVKYGTWKEVIEVRSRDIYSPESIHRKTLETFKDDQAIIYVLSDIQSRIRQKVKLVTQEYYKNKDWNNEIRSYNLVDEVDGEKVITATTNTLDNMIAQMLQQIQTPSRFVDDELITALSNKFTAINQDMFRRVLYAFTENAQLQFDSGDSKKTIRNRKDENALIYVGAELLITELIQKTYRFCILMKTNMKSKGDILTKTINLYSSSRVSDEDILTIKRSVVYFITNTGESVRPATIASMSIAFILYVIIRSMQYL